MLPRYPTDGRAGLLCGWSENQARYDTDFDRRPKLAELLLRHHYTQAMRYSENKWRQCKEFE